MKYNNRKFNIFGIEWEILYVDTVFLIDDTNPDSLVLGCADSLNKIIKVAIHDKNGKKLPDSTIINTLYHEIMHAICIEGQYQEANSDEPFIEWLSKCILSLKNQKVL